MGIKLTLLQSSLVRLVVTGLAVTIFAGLPGRAGAETQAITVTVKAEPTGPELSRDFVGLSYETGRELEAGNGSHYFDASNKALINIFNTLGIKSLRVGGNSVDDSKVLIPQPPDIDVLYAFAKAAGVKVIYSFRLRQEADAAVPLAKYIYDHYADLTDCLCIGNEPEFMFKGDTAYEQFKAVWKPQFDAITKAVPTAKIGGPSTGRGEPFAIPLAKDFVPTGKMAFISTHHYFLGRGPVVQKEPEKLREAFLSDDLHTAYDGVYDTVGKMMVSLKIPYRLDETNSCSRGGAKDGE